jgi:pimeloyl-ACP methyl ester carboxylesterase
VSLRYQEAGQGPLVLCLHGFPDNAHTCSERLPALARAGLRGVAPFMRGYAPTSPAPDGRYQAVLLAQDALALIAALGGGRASVVAHDWGATAASYFFQTARCGDRRARLLSLHVPPGRPRPRAPGGAGPFVHIERPGDVNRRIVEFLQATERRPP